jgi:hypothetical protein
MGGPSHLCLQAQAIVIQVLLLAHSDRDHVSARALSKPQSTGPEPFLSGELNWRRVVLGAGLGASSSLLVE